MKINAVVFDLDGTLASNAHCRDLTIQEWDWGTFARGAAQAPYYEITGRIWASTDDLERIVLTARPEALRDQTYKWLVNNLGFNPNGDRLIMMPNADVARVDRSCSTINELQKAYAAWKITQLDYLSKEHYINMVFEDNEEAIKLINQELKDTPTCLIKMP